MKVIDLLNEIAKGEQPSHIRIYDRDWYWNNYDGYVTEGSLSTTPDAQLYLFSSYRLDFALDKEVEIIEEDKEIEEIKDIWGSDGYLDMDSASDMVDKINELIKAVNELKKGK